MAKVNVLWESFDLNFCFDWSVFLQLGGLAFDWSNDRLGSTPPSSATKGLFISKMLGFLYLAVF